MDNNGYKAIATGVTFGIYAVAFFSILGYVSTVHYAAKIKPASTEVVIDITMFQPTKPEEKEPTPPPKPEEETVAKKPMPSKSLKSLFDDDNTTLDEKELFAKRHIPPTRRKPKIDVDELFDASVERQQVSKKIVDKMEASTKSDSGASLAASDGVTDEYFAKVQEAIASGWNPLARQKGMEASLVLKISTDGSFSFYIRGATGDKEFLDMLKQHMEKLQRTGLPKPEKSTTINTNFIAKE